MYSRDSVTVKYACAALCRLCVTLENSETIAKSGVVKTLVSGVVDEEEVLFVRGTLFCPAIHTFLLFKI